MYSGTHLPGYGPIPKVPFPYYGGKSTVAHMVWDRFGDVPNYVEPFAGTLAVLLRRPRAHKRLNETVNDLSCYISNFWRAVHADPRAVARHCDWPVNEVDLAARHDWLLRSKEGLEFQEAMKADPDYFDARIAGWWVWGQSCWVGNGWCHRVNPDGHRRPKLSNGGMGVHRKRPHLGRGGCGVHRTHEELPELMAEFAARLRRVRVCCGDFERVLSPNATSLLGRTGVFLDPPYLQEVLRKKYAKLYAEGYDDVANRARQWAIDRGHDPAFRIAFCGYQGEHDQSLLFDEKGAWPEGWTCQEWAPEARAQRHQNQRERIWFSPHCLEVQDAEAKD